MNKLTVFLCAIIFAFNANAATVVATVAGKPVTDADITARVKLMNKQGKTSTDNRRVALQNIIDDQVKLDYARNFNAIPSDEDVEKELKAMDLGDMNATERAMAKSAVQANIAWQIIIGRTIMPTVDASKEDITEERRALERERGLPIEITMIRLIDIPVEVATKLTKPKSCDDAMKIARDLGGDPQKITAAQYELSLDIRERIVGLPKLTWSPRVDNSVLLVCSEKKTSDYGKLDEIIKQNTVFKKSLFIADQQLKQLRRKAVVVIHDDRYQV
ncbi:SurA N-terminal domain-containing protein [Lachnospiraceae bacterium OttesenSCG-928-E19]|nr:SurA N-terminal domain-containing protein [Lachnospiraceae bacterium OttesenSCG-928-E19]